MQTIPTLYDWAGGREALERLTTVFYGHVNGDPILAPVFAHMGEGHSRHVAHFIGEVFGGPALYTGEDQGSHAEMIGHHLGKRLNETQRQRWMELFLQSCDETGVASDPEFRSALVGYLEWGTRLAVINSNTEVNPIEERAPMPKWGWGETGGPYVAGE